jgi:hypothetical protein
MIRRRNVTHLLLTALLGSILLAATPTWAVETIQILVMRVEFPFEEEDDFTTGGRGLFDLRTPEEALSDDDENENPFRYPYDTPPHGVDYLNNHLTALANYVDVASRSQVELEWFIYPPEGDAYTAPKNLAWYGSASDDKEQFERWVTFLYDALDLVEPDIPRIKGYDSYLVFNSSISFQDILSTELPALALTPAEFERFGIDMPSETSTPQGKSSMWFIPQQIQQPGGVIGMNGTFVSTFLASLGVPVLVNTATGGSSVGGWTVMDIGSDNLIQRRTRAGDTTSVLGFVPCLPMAWEQIRLGWLEPVEVHADTTINLAYLGLRDTELPHAIKVPITGDEYFLIELRKSIRDSGTFPDWDHPEIELSVGDTSAGESEGSVWLRPENDFYDAYTPGSGVLVYHVDEERIRQWEPTNEINSHRERPSIYLVEADGYRDVGLTNFFGHPRSSEGIGSPRDPFSVTGDTLYALGDVEPGHPVSLANDGSHSGIRIITSQLGVTGDSVAVTVEWVDTPDVPQRVARDIGAPVVEGITVGAVFEEWSGESTEQMVLFATQDGNIWLLNSDLEPMYTTDGVVGHTDITLAHKPEITGSGEITVHGADAVVRFQYASSGGQGGTSTNWVPTTTSAAAWIPPNMQADLDRDGTQDVVLHMSLPLPDGTYDSKPAMSPYQDYTIIGQPTIGIRPVGSSDGFGYAYYTYRRRVDAVSRTGLELARFELGFADSTEAFTGPTLTTSRGAVLPGKHAIWLVDGDLTDARKGPLVPGTISGAGALLQTESGQTGAYVATEQGWIYGYPGLLGDAVPLWGQYYADAAHSNTVDVTQFPGQVPTITAVMPSDRAFCWPSPVGNAEGHLRFYLTQRADVEARVYNAVGELVWRGSREMAATNPNTEHDILWPGGTEFASGLYLIRLEATAENGSHSGVTIPVGIVR